MFLLVTPAVRSAKKRQAIGRQQITPIADVFSSGKLRRKFHAQGGFGRNLMQRYYNKYRYLVHRDPVGWYDIHAAI